MRTLYIECNMGAAGDMLMSALYELLEDKQGFLDKMNRLGLPGVRIRPVPAVSCGIAGTRMEVMVNGHEEEQAAEESMLHHHGHHHDHFHVHTHTHPHADGHDHHTHVHADREQIHHLIRHLDLPQQVKDQAEAVYDRIAEAEAKAHGCPVGEVHFHEVGALDAVADVTGVCYAMYLLAPEKIVVSPVHVGSGTVRCAHGIMPVPAPATANLLEGVPIYGGTVKGELCTPTGAALLVCLSDRFGFMPVMQVESHGIGIGTREFEQANCVRVFLGQEVSQEERKCGEEADGIITELICNVDDMTPEALAFACGRLLEEGALDVYTLPGTMKKGRPGHVLTVLCRPEEEQKMVQCVLRETTTNGLRSRNCKKYFLQPSWNTVRTKWGEVRIKTACGHGVFHQKPEYEDIARLARDNGVPYETVLEETRLCMKETAEKETEPS